MMMAVVMKMTTLVYIKYDDGGRGVCSDEDDGWKVLRPCPKTPRPLCRKPDILVPYLYVDMGAAVLCASFMSFGVKRRWFALAAAVQLALSTYASYLGQQVLYSDWLKVSAAASGLLPLLLHLLILLLLFLL